jgi:hypothetical protein
VETGEVVEVGKWVPTIKKKVEYVLYMSAGEPGRLSDL